MIFGCEAIKFDSPNEVQFILVRKAGDMIVVTAVLCCHNRKDKTLACAEGLYGLRRADGCSLGVVVVDDGSTDGTAEELALLYPGVDLIRGDGSLYWCGGMRVGWRRAAEGDPDYYLLVNDDTELETGALEALLAVVGGADERVIGVGAIRAPETGLGTYGGWRRKGGLRMVPPSGRVESCDTFNANCVLVPRVVYREMGVFHDAYTHAMGDFDYGFQACRRGIKVLQTSGFVGTCERNSLANTWRDRRLGRRERLRKLHHPKAHPWHEAVAYHRRNSGFLWPWRCITPYLRIMIGK